MQNKSFRMLFGLLVAALFLTGCYWNDDVRTDQTGVKVDGGRIVECLPPGVYSDTGFFTDLVEISAGTVTFEVTDPEVATQDSQLVGVTVSIQARRKSDCESVKNMLTNWSSLINDEALVAVATATANEGMKVGTRSFTLQELLDDRNGLADKIREALEVDASKYSVEIINVTVKNVALDPNYATVLQEKALLTAQIETEQRRQDLIRQQAANAQLEQQQKAEVLKAQLDAEKAQTSVQVEIASRDGKLIDARNSVYLTNAPAFELERLRLLKDVLGDKAVFYFLPEGTDLTLLLNSASQSPTVIPVAPE